MSKPDSDFPRRSKMPKPMQIAIAISLCDVINMEAPVELGLRAAKRIGIGRRRCQERSDRAVERMSEFREGIFRRQPAGTRRAGHVLAESRRRVRQAGHRPDLLIGGRRGRPPAA